MPIIVLPVGFSVGPRYRISDPPDPEMRFYEISLGRDSMELDDDEAKVMGAVTADPDRHSRFEITRVSVSAFLQTINDGVADPIAVIDRMKSQGLLLEFDPIDSPPDELERVFRGYRLYPTAEGLGATPEEPRKYRIGHGGVPILVVDNLTFTIWAYSRNFPSLWENCADFADDRDFVAAGGKPLGLTVEEVARKFAPSIPMLVASGCAFLDPVAD